MGDSEEPSASKKRRGRPSCQLSSEEKQKKKETKNRIDKKSREENRDALERLSLLTPSIRRLVELFDRNHENIKRFQDVMERFKEGAPQLEAVVKLAQQGNPVELQQDEGRFQEILDAIKRLSEAVQAQNVLRTLMESNDEELKAGIERQREQIRGFQNEALQNLRDIEAMINSRLPDELAPSRPQPEPCFSDFLQDLMHAPLGMGLTEQEQPRTPCFNNEECGNQFNLDNPSNQLTYSLLNVPVPPCPTSSNQNDASSWDEQVKTFFKKFDGKTKRNARYSDFKGLQEAMKNVGQTDIPDFLRPISEEIQKIHGDVAGSSKQSPCAIHPTLLMFYATIKEIEELQCLADITDAKLEVWSDAIIDAQQFKFKVDFAEEQLKKIARAFFASQDPNLEQQKQILEHQLNEIKEKIERRDECLDAAKYFNDKPLSRFP